MARSKNVVIRVEIGVEVPSVHLGFPCSNEHYIPPPIYRAALKSSFFFEAVAISEVLVDVSPCHVLLRGHYQTHPIYYLGQKINVIL